MKLGGPLIVTGFLLTLAGDWERGTAILRRHPGWTKRSPGVVHSRVTADQALVDDLVEALALAGVG
ncbi:hypothetical protein [Sorangium cellulosum]|uniref:Uncharacterized protein n=1 Tax=Sorangium cellulosum TaxID=56 RepID=A0A150QWM3_SORCE|nr:hypothetical protein [Sorangium cellulosum]KYF71968.1 hypothetical protein BE15_46520 [Sorangium cellulosum]